MFRSLICSILRLALRIFFRRIEIAGIERVPADQPVIFVLNHPNGLVDPVFLLCLSGRRVSFLAKEPLFRMPFIGTLVRTLDALPVYRQQDQGADTSKNKLTFEAARKLLSSGGALAICPEGVSHDEPRLKPIKSGAARIALGAASTGKKLDIQIVPAGLYYTAKTTFRSSALLYFGDPIEVQAVTVDTNGEPPRDAVAQLSEKIEAALRDVMLHAEQGEGLSTVERAERIFSAELPGDDDSRSLSRELELRKLFLESYLVLHDREPARVQRLEARLRRYEQQLEQINLEPDEIERPNSSVAPLLRLTAHAFVFAVLSPIAVLGVAINYPAYRLAGYFSRRLSKNADDIVSTIKIIAALLFFPATWILATSIAWYFFGLKFGLAILVVSPFSGYLAMRFFEELDSFVSTVRSLAYYLTKRRYFLRLVVERRAIADEILSMGRELQHINNLPPISENPVL